MFTVCPSLGVLIATKFCDFALELLVSRCLATPPDNIKTDFISIPYFPHVPIPRRYYLDDRPSDVEAVQALCAQLTIDPRNPCQFLAQDAASEFPRLAPQEILAYSLRAAGERETLQLLEDLTESQVGLRDRLKICKKFAKKILCYQINNWP